MKEGTYLKVTPVCGGGSVRNVAGSTCGRAGLLFLRMILRPFIVATAVVAVSGPAADVVVATAVSVLSVGMSDSGDRDLVAIGAAAASLDTSAMVVLLCDFVEKMRRERTLHFRCGSHTQSFAMFFVMMMRLPVETVASSRASHRNCRRTPPNFLSPVALLIEKENMST